MSLIDRNEIVKDLVNMQSTSSLSIAEFLILLHSKPAINMESSWNIISVDTPIGTFTNYSCENCKKVVGEIDKITPHCPYCGKKMVNFKELYKK